MKRLRLRLNEVERGGRRSPDGGKREESKSDSHSCILSRLWTPFFLFSYLVLRETSEKLQETASFLIRSIKTYNMGTNFNKQTILNKKPSLLPICEELYN